MKKFITLLLAVTLIFISCNSKKEKTAEASEETVTIQYVKELDTTAIKDFYVNYPKLAQYKGEMDSLYQKYNNSKIWFDENGLKEFANSLFSNYLALDQDGVETVFPYQDELEFIFHRNRDSQLSQTETDVMLTYLYFFYADQVVGGGISDDEINELGWLLPRKKISYENLLDSILENPETAIKKENLQIEQYFKLKTALSKYREIENNGGWPTIDVAKDFKSLKPGDSTNAIGQIRNRLYITGDIDNNNNSLVYDKTLEDGVSKYLLRNGFNKTSTIIPEHITVMNIPVADRIKNIMVNMERCRWISPEYEQADEYIMVNIPSYYLFLIRDNEAVFESPVVVGKTMSKTVIFSGNMSYIVFSPYWNLPTSIINKDVKPGMAKNPNYLEEHRMEWNNGNVRQKPGRNNSLGLVKFIFPNSNSIYLHDTPAKSLFGRETRAYSHGCIRVGKPRDLAVKILENDKNWTPAKIDAAMDGRKERTYVLKNKIPVYIGYFTCWVRPDGSIDFYKDIYKRDEHLANLIFTKN